MKQKIYIDEEIASTFTGNIIKGRVQLGVIEMTEDGFTLDIPGLLENTKCYFETVKPESNET